MPVNAPKSNNLTRDSMSLSEIDIFSVYIFNSLKIVEDACSP